MSKEKRSAKSLDKIARKAAKKAARIVGVDSKPARDKSVKTTKTAAKSVKTEKAVTKPAKTSNLVGKLQALQLRGQTVITIPVKKKYTPEDLTHIASVLEGSAVKPAKKTK